MAHVSSIERRGECGDALSLQRRSHTTSLTFVVVRPLVQLTSTSFASLGPSLSLNALSLDAADVPGGVLSEWALGGIEVLVSRSTSTMGCGSPPNVHADGSVVITTSSAATPMSDNRAAADVWATSLTTDSLGDAGDRWGIEQDLVGSMY